MIQHRIEHGARDDESDLLSLLIEANQHEDDNRLTNEELLADTYIFLFAGAFLSSFSSINLTLKVMTQPAMLSIGPLCICVPFPMSRTGPTKR